MKTEHWVRYDMLGNRITRSEDGVWERCRECVTEKDAQVHIGSHKRTVLNGEWYVSEWPPLSEAEKERLRQKFARHCDTCGGMCQLAEGYTHRDAAGIVADYLVDTWREQRRKMPRDMR